MNKKPSPSTGYSFIFIRHAQKKYDNYKGPKGQPKCDPSITLEGGKICLNRGKELREKFGEPTEIFTSPYLRARQTSEILSNGKTPITIVTALSEFAGNRPYYSVKTTMDENGKEIKKLDPTPDVHPETLKYGPIPNTIETINQLKKRTKAFIKALSRVNPKVNIGLSENQKIIEPGVYWFVSHGVVITKAQTSYITFKYDVDLQPRFSNLSGFIAKDMKVKLLPDVVHEITIEDYSDASDDSLFF